MEEAHNRRPCGEGRGGGKNPNIINGGHFGDFLVAMKARKLRRRLWDALQENDVMAIWLIGGEILPVLSLPLPRSLDAPSVIDPAKWPPKESGMLLVNAL